VKIFPAAGSLFAYATPLGKNLESPCTLFSNIIKHQARPTETKHIEQATRHKQPIKHLSYIRKVHSAIRIVHPFDPSIYGIPSSRISFQASTYSNHATQNMVLSWANRKCHPYRSLGPYPWLIGAKWPSEAPFPRLGPKFPKTAIVHVMASTLRALVYGYFYVQKMN
jgi:hypothetical protein